MSVIILESGNLGPFKSIEVLQDRLRADNVGYPFSVIGDYTISEDDSLAPPAPVPPEAVPESVPMASARKILIRTGHIDAVNAAVAQAGAEAQADWEYQVNVRRDNELVNQLGTALGLDLDALFIAAAAL